MILLGLAGRAAAGKSTVASHLVKRYGFVQSSFSDAIYREVVEAFGLEDDFQLRDRELKETPSERLSLIRCADLDFREVGEQQLSILRATRGMITLPSGVMPLSPRFVLQAWGSYRRVTDPYYWINAAEKWMFDTIESAPYAELRQALFVNDSVRFDNEREWVNSFAPFGSIWHINRDNAAPVHAHESETPLEVLDGERQIWNNGNIGHLCQAVDLLLSTEAPTVRCEPMDMTDPRDISGQWQHEEQV